MARPKNLQVIEVGEGWVVRREGLLPILSMHDDEHEAVEVALAMAAREGVKVYVQGRDGRFRLAGNHLHAGGHH